MLAYSILARKRDGQALTAEEIRAVVGGASDGTWSDAQLSAFLMAAYLRGLDEQETHHLTQAMLESGDQWDLAAEYPTLVDKHSTGGVGDKVSLVLAPLLAACDVPVVMLTGRALGHTAGTADKLDSIAGLRQELDRSRCRELLASHRMAIGVATADIAPADRVLYRLRDQTATVESLPLITGSILSKKLASGAAALVFDVKTGNGAFMREVEQARGLAQLLVSVTRAAGRKASAVVTDMSQPLGDWVGHAAEIRECLDCLAGEGGSEVVEVTLTLAAELLGQIGAELDRADLRRVLETGKAREVFERWASAQGAESDWIQNPMLALAPHEVVIESNRSGVLTGVDTRRIGLLMVEAGAGRSTPGQPIDMGVSMHYASRLGASVDAGQELARLYLRQPNEDLTRRLEACFEVGAAGTAPDLIVERVGV